MRSAAVSCQVADAIQDVAEGQARDELRFRLNIALGQFVEAAHDAVQLARFEQVGAAGLQALARGCMIPYTAAQGRALSLLPLLLRFLRCSAGGCVTSGPSDMRAATALAGSLSRWCSRSCFAPC